MSKQYNELLKDPQWQKRRLKTFDRDGWKCTKCHNNKRELHDHHTYYLDNRAPWEYPDDAIITLCSDCHYMEHIPTLNPDSRPVKSILTVMKEFIEGLQKRAK